MECHGHGGEHVDGEGESSETKQEFEEADAAFMNLGLGSDYSQYVSEVFGDWGESLWIIGLLGVEK